MPYCGIAGHARPGGCWTRPAVRLSVAVSTAVVLVLAGIYNSTWLAAASCCVCCGAPWDCRATWGGGQAGKQRPEEVPRGGHPQFLGMPGMPMTQVGV